MTQENNRKSLRLFRHCTALFVLMRCGQPVIISALLTNEPTITIVYLVYIVLQRLVILVVGSRSSSLRRINSDALIVRLGFQNRLFKVSSFYTKYEVFV